MTLRYHMFTSNTPLYLDLSTNCLQAHHIASEQKRRENIRSTFDKIVALTPSLNEHENRSELNILTKSADYIDALKQENEQLVALCRTRNIEVPSKLKYNGPGPEKMD